MAFQTQRPDVLEIAFAAAFHYRHYMIRIPQALAPAWLQAPVSKHPQTRGASLTPQVQPGRLAVDPADRADSPIAS